MANAILDTLRWLNTEHVEQRLAELVNELVPTEEGALDVLRADRVAAVVFERTGLPPAEFAKLPNKGKLVFLERAANPAEKQPQQPHLPESPAPLLLSWREIADALGRPNAPEFRSAIMRLSEQHDGPLVKLGQGAQPKVDRDKLVAWWNGLEARLAELDGRKRDQVETVKDQYLYGSDGEVVPDIGGSVKHRRSDST